MDYNGVCNFQWKEHNVKGRRCSIGFFYPKVTSASTKVEKRFSFSKKSNQTQSVIESCVVRAAANEPTTTAGKTRGAQQKSISMTTSNSKMRGCDPDSKMTQSDSIPIPEVINRSLNGGEGDWKSKEILRSLPTLFDFSGFNEGNQIKDKSIMNSKKHSRGESDFYLTAMKGSDVPAATSNKRRRRSDFVQSLSAWRNDKVSTIRTLRQFLTKKSRTALFRQFLKQEFSEENLDFWLAVESYKKLKGTKLAKEAHCIFETYILVGSSKEINIDAATRTFIVNNIKSADVSTFDAAQSKVFVLMERDSFRRFLLKEFSITSILSPKKETFSRQEPEKHRKDRKTPVVSALDFPELLHPNITARIKRNSSR
uniref:RGS domain-containing protein n=1 Tax=Ciona savignyi TaxID=51511 RepID=H2Z840_CIOSA